MIKVKQDEVRVRTMRHLQSNPQGQVSDLLKNGYELNIIKEMESIGLISITQLFTEDKHGRYQVTNFGKEYFKVVA